MICFLATALRASIKPDSPGTCHIRKAGDQKLRTGPNFMDKKIPVRRIKGV